MNKFEKMISHSAYSMGEPRLDARPFNNGKICCKSCFENIVIPYRNHIQDKMEMEEIDKWISENND